MSSCFIEYAVDISDLSRVLKQYLFGTKISDRYRVVYGGAHTVLLDKDDGRRLCKVTRESGVKDNLTKAVLYLIAKWRGVYGSEIQRYLDEGCTSQIDLLYYLLQYGYRSSYTRDDIRKYSEIIKNEPDDEVGFLYVLLIDRFHYGKEELDQLVEEAVCSETEKTKKRLAKKAKPKRPRKPKAKSREDLEKL